jgi:hypothetical protein
VLFEGVILRDNASMATTLEGVYRNGKIELPNLPDEAESSRVVVTWIQGAESVELDALGIDAAQAADLRHRLSAFAEDWDGPEMAVYDELPSR